MSKRRFSPIPSKSGSELLRGAMIAAVASLAFALHPASADVTWDGGAGTNRYLDANNWSDDQVPGSTSGHVSIEQKVTVVLDDSAPTLATGQRLRLVNGAVLDVTGGTTTVGNLRIVSTDNSALKISGGTLSFTSMGGNSSVNGGAITITSGTLIGAISGTTGAGIQGNTTISGGSFLINAVASAATEFGGYGTSDVTISGGNFLINHNVTAGRLNSSGQGPMNLVITGGTFSSVNYSQNWGKVDISDGHFTATGNLVWSGTFEGRFGASNRSIKVTGGLGTVSVGGDFTTTESNTGTREFVLTARNSGVTQENIAKISVAGTDSAGGDIKTSLQGGILLAKPTEYTLVSAGSLTGEFNYTGTTLYNGAVVGNDYKITLNNAVKQGELSITAYNTPVETTFALASVGYVDVDLTSVFDDATSMLVRLDANAGSGTMEGLAAYLAQSGYTDVALDASGDYDISFTIDSAFFSGDQMYLSWDLLGYATGAGLTGVQIGVIPEPGTIALLSASGCFVLMRRLRSRRYNGKSS